MKTAESDLLTLRPWEFVQLEDEEQQESEQHLELSLFRHQKEFVDDTTTEEIALVGGFGCGKTEAFINKAISLAALCAGKLTADGKGLLIEPNETQLQMLLRPRFEAILDDLHIPYSLKLGNPRTVFTLHFDAGDVPIVLMPAGAGAANFRGLQCAFVGVDEADTIDPDKLWDLWVSLSSRMRGCVDTKYPHYQMFVTTTPEGFGFCYEHWVADLEEEPELEKKRRLIRGKTKWNPKLPDGYIDNLKAQYPKNLLSAYLEGEFVNLEGNVVYGEFDRQLNGTTRTLDTFQSRQPIHIGIDFNVYKMCAVVVMIEGIKAYAVDEITGQKNTKSLIKEIKERYAGRRIFVYPDAAGRQQTSNADASNIQLLQDAGFTVLANSRNPRVSNRVASVNTMLCNAKDERRLFINVKKCPVLVKSLEQQKYRNGEPDKKSDLDHPNDALGYFIWYRYPLLDKPTATVYR